MTVVFRRQQGCWFGWSGLSRGKGVVDKFGGSRGVEWLGLEGHWKGFAFTVSSTGRFWKVLTWESQDEVNRIILPAELWLVERQQGGKHEDLEVRCNNNLARVIEVEYEKHLQSGCVLKVDLSWFADGLDEGFERMTESKIITGFVLEKLKGWSLG